MSEFAANFLQKIKLHTQKSSSEISFENLKKSNPNLNENNIFAIAFLACNESLPEEDREIFKQSLEMKLRENYEQGTQAKPQ